MNTVVAPAPTPAARTATDLLRTYQAFAEHELLPSGDHFDTLPDQPTDATLSLHRQGLANWWIPAEFGGHGVPLRTSVDIVSRLSYADAGFAFGAFLPVLGAVMLQLYGRPELSEPILRQLAADGGSIGVMGSEQNAGSELTRTETTFEIVDDEIVIDGSKFFSTNADQAEVLLILARARQGDDYAMIAVPRRTAGVRITKRWDMIGVRGSATYAAQLTGCRVPASNRLQGNGLRILEVGLNASRILIAATAVGISRRIRDLALDYATGKQVKGAALMTNPVFAGKIGQIEASIDVMRNQCLAAAAEFDDHLSGSAPSRSLYRVGALRSALTAKLFCGQTGWQIASTGSEMFGGLGFTHEHPIGKLVRDMRYVAIVEGGEDVTRELLFSRFAASAAKRL